MCSVTVLAPVSNTWELVSGLCIFTTSLRPGEGGPTFPKAGFVSLPPLEHEHSEGKGALLSPRPLPRLLQGLVILVERQVSPLLS